MRECPRCEKCFADEIEVCPEDQIGTKITLPGTALLNSRYLLEKRLGRGAMGQVYLAQDQNLLTRRVAVKTVRPDILTSEDMQEGEAIARFEREARTAASIRHPNVVDVTDFGKSPEGVFFLVMEYVQGETLYHLLRREGTLNPQRTLKLLRQVAAGVEAAHDEGILHRDLKPANIFIMKSKKKKSSKDDGFVKVGDFGLAKIVSEAAQELDAASGGPQSRGIIGTPEYMAPEQMQTGAQLDARADVYALGVIAYHMLGGRPPFTGDLMQLVMQKMMQSPPPLREIRSDLTPDVERVVMRALAKEPDGRPASVTAFVEELETAVESDDEPETNTAEESRVIVMAAVGAEVYLDDERKGSVGRSGRIVLSQIAPGNHVLRVAQAGLQDDERVIEIRLEGGEQIIQASTRASQGSQISPSMQSIGIGHEPSMPSVVACAQCGSRFASGVKFCGRCGGTIFHHINAATGGSQPGGSVPNQTPSGFNQPGGSVGGYSQPSHSSQPPSTPASFPSANAGGGYNAPSNPNAGNPNFASANPGQPTPNGASRFGQYNQPQTNFSGAQFPPSNNAPSPDNQPSGVTCQKCHTPYAAHIKFCGRCGIPLQAAATASHIHQSANPSVGVPLANAPKVTCKSCFAIYPAGTKFCGRCGSTIPSI